MPARVIMDRMLDYQWSQVLQKQQQHNCSLDEAIAMQLAEIAAS